MKFYVIALLLGAASAVNLEKTDAVEDVTMVQVGAPCIYLDETQKELDYQLEMFSRTLDTRHWTNAQNVAKKLASPKMRVSTWELYNKAFSFPRVRRYAFVQENMDMLEHFQDNLNLNISNTAAMENFLRTANAVMTAINDKYHDGEFSDPGGYDPRKDKKSIYFKDDFSEAMPA